MREFSLDQVLFVPTGDPYFKTREGRNVTPAADRLAMVAIAIEDHPGFAVSDIEVRRKGHTYTADTIAELRRIDPDAEYYFIVGADALSQMDSWYAPEMIFSEVSVIVANRDHQVPDDSLDATILRLKERFGARIYRMDFESIDLSSTIIRNQFERGAARAAGIPAKVCAYIVEHNLYPEVDLDAGE